MTYKAKADAMAEQLLKTGADEDAIEETIESYLRAQGWTGREASRRATDSVMRAVAKRDGFAGGGRP